MNNTKQANKQSKKEALARAIIADFRNKKLRDPKDENELTLFVLEEGGEKYLLKMQAKLAKAALHGAKLNYIKSLKNQCAEDEEVVYFKLGGSVGCGCKKKEDGGEIAKAQKGSAVEKFKAMKMQKAGKVRTKAELDRINKQSEEDAINGTYGLNKKQIKHLNNPKVTKETYNSMDGDPHGNKIQRVITHREPTMKNDTTYNRTLHSLYGDNRLKFSSSNNGDRKQYKKDEESFNRAKSHSSVTKKACGGSAVKKFKKHRQGGSLNHIPFMQSGTPKSGIHLNELEEKQFDPLPPNASRELFVLYYGLPKNFFELDLPTKRKMFLEAYNRVNLPKQKNIIDIIHPESTMQPVIPNTGLGQKTFGTYFKKTL